MLKCDFNKVALATLLKPHFRHTCSPVNLLHIFRSTFLTNTFGGLLLFSSLCYGLLLLTIIQNKNYPSLKVCHVNNRIFQDIIWNGIALKLTVDNRTGILWRTQISVKNFVNHSIRGQIREISEPASIQSYRSDNVDV